MALQALGIDTTEDEVNKVLGARPMKGASWEQVLAAAQHYGCRATLTMPSTVAQLKSWTDRGVPVLIAWNPEGREWSHASTVFHVEDRGEGEQFLHIADPNIPNPSKTVRVVHEDEFYGKWYEKWPNYLVRRPAVAIEREVTPEGRQVQASRKPGDPEYQEWAEGQLEEVVSQKGIEARSLPGQIGMLAWENGYEGIPLEPWLLFLGKTYRVDVRGEHKKGENGARGIFAAQRVADRWLTARKKKKKTQPVVQKKDPNAPTKRPAPKKRNEIVRHLMEKGGPRGGTHGGGKRTRNRRDRQKSKRDLRQHD